jgi:hypothetical protein
MRLGKVIHERKNHRRIESYRARGSVEESAGTMMRSTSGWKTQRASWRRGSQERAGFAGGRRTPILKLSLNHYRKS